MPIITPTVATFSEERYQRDKSLAILQSVLANLAVTPHVFVGQGFDDYIKQNFANNTTAEDDAKKVFVLLNDDGTGINNKFNTAIGYRLALLADIFKEMGQLPMDMLPNIPLDAPIDGQERFNEAFFASQFRLPASPKMSGNLIMDFIANLHHVEIVVKVIQNILNGYLLGNAQKLYTHDTTKKSYDNLVANYSDIAKQISKSIKVANKIINKPEYMDGLVIASIEKNNDEDQVVAKTGAEAVAEFLSRYKVRIAALNQ